MAKHQPEPDDGPQDAPPPARRKLLPSKAAVDAAIAGHRLALESGEAKPVDPGMVPMTKSGHAYGRDYLVVEKADGMFRVVTDFDGNVIDVYKVARDTGGPRVRMGEDDKNLILVKLHEGYGLTQAARYAGYNYTSFQRERRLDRSFDRRVRDASRTRTERLAQVLWDAATGDEPDLNAAYRLLAHESQVKGANLAKNQWTRLQAMRERLAEARIKAMGFESEPTRADMKSLTAKEFSRYSSVFERVMAGGELSQDDEVFFGRVTVRLARANNVKQIEGH